MPTLKTCNECNSEFYKETSQMEGICPECASLLYGYENCEHEFENNRCVKCYWKGNSSSYLKNNDTEYCVSIKQIIRILLVLSTSSIVLNCFFILINGRYNEFSLLFSWYSILATFLTIISSTISLLIISMYIRARKGNVWLNIKKELVILGLAILSILILGLLNNYK